MTGFDRVAMVDWSGGNDTGPRPRKDAIWMAEAGKTPVYLRNRVRAEQALSDLIADALENGQRLFLGFDFPFGYPAGFARALTGRADPFAVWRFLAERLDDTPDRNSRFHLGAELNRRFPGIGPFWFNALREDIPDLPRKDIRAGHGMAERRACEQAAKGAFSCWQLGGAGAVGGQVLTGLPVLHRLRHRFPEQIAVWPFEPLTRPVAVVEVWPSLINDVVRQVQDAGVIRDAAQVALLAAAIAALPPAVLATMLDVQSPEEGWIFGLGHEDTLRATAAELDKSALL
ncbi:molybdopterin guanine dinucleotide synthesis [Mesobacterium sp. TK19101]|uniref:Molybdopterin guanine dinucleotide synthesis n=1 Tax=Mesobacterium hydrothermale TaxID=3111907 RepID=A0ABU6HJU5_9RHOB|nr:molybdopterin guanine dinucleotide synthesis [Mesobacterium sp. TK19101]MEC3862714.1 molybdopterin guanine dinucleotide synthesis [Mesobacterium sp. TK19101]